MYDSLMRDMQPINFVFTELLPYHITAKDRVLKENIHTIAKFYKQVKAEKLEQIRKGNVGTDLFSILLSEGGDVYDEDDVDDL